MGIRPYILPALKWVGTLTGIAAGCLIALNISISGWGFAIFLVSSLSWGTAAFLMGETSLLLLQGVFTIINALGIYRWLIA